MQHNKISAEEYRKLIINAAQCLEDNKEEINELNVFPVPDGDTGSNMSMTVGHAAEELLKNKDASIEEVAVKTAKAMLHGARGNSGVIISLLFRGIAKGLENSTDCDGIAWAKALQYGVEAAYKSVDRPAEGTILTVARCCADAAMKAAEEKNSFEYVLSAAIKEAEKALANTVYQNPVLEKAGVVDAGGKGWLLVMQAMLHALNKDDVSYSPKSSVATDTKEKADFSSFDTEDITFGFCTEFIVRKHNGDDDSTPLKAYLNGMGDSIVLVDDGEIIKVHVHTNDPHAVLGEALKYGVYETVKVENMRTQHTNKLVEADSVEPKKELKKYGFVSVSNGEGINAIFTELGVDVIVSGGQTMNPSTEDLFKAVEQIDAENVFILPNNKNIIMTANQVAELTDKNVIVIPTKSIPQGFTAMLGFDPDDEAEVNKGAMTEIIKDVDTMQITYAARNSNFDDMDIKEGDYLALCNNKLLCSDKDLNVLYEALAEKIKESGKGFVSIYYGEGVTEDEAQTVLSFFEEKLRYTDAEITLYNGAQPVYYYIISAE
ncbi:MAG: DAK2 domain-containing protein [Clostridia bacterium]|nr:DAK2 domain-containing protein [Clostridia bacterium]